ncbi:MAG: DUF4397 domain-containing protein, partial [Heliobacteriaceae bacterium]|nr:DUF4397 domain-containing protein [Heliobacteriaceae bacterium]
MYDEGNEIFDCPCLVYDDPGQDYSGFGDDDGSQAMQLRRSFIRLLHAAPNAPAVDVFIDNRLVANNLAYRRFTTYLPVGQGRHRVRVYPTGNRRRPVLDTTVQVAPNSIATVAVI